jgi:triphosphoribosyl-dephospho-CoA synthase
MKAIEKTDTSDAVAFYRAFSLTKVHTYSSDDLDVNDPESLSMLRERDMTLLDVMQHSAEHDMVAREWVTGYTLTRRGADLLKQFGNGRQAIVRMFITLLAQEPDTFIVKKHGVIAAQETMRKAREVLEGKETLANFDQDCIDRDINPGSIADITIAALFVALGEGWEWDS